MTWTAIAQVWGLASRQAAEQRFLRLSARLARHTARRQESADAPYGPDVPALRQAAGGLLHALRSDQRWTHGPGRATLARATLEAAAEGPPGALYDLLVHAIADIDAGSVSGADPLPPAVRRAMEVARQATAAATPH